MREDGGKRGNQGGNSRDQKIFCVAVKSKTNKCSVSNHSSPLCHNGRGPTPCSKVRPLTPSLARPRHRVLLATIKKNW